MVETSPSNAGGMGSLPGQAAKILYASGPENQTKQKQHWNKFNKTLKMPQGLLLFSQAPIPLDPDAGSPVFFPIYLSHPMKPGGGLIAACDSISGLPRRNISFHIQDE